MRTRQGWRIASIDLVWATSGSLSLHQVKSAIATVTGDPSMRRTHVLSLATALAMFVPMARADEKDDLTKEIQELNNITGDAALEKVNRIAPKKAVDLSE